MPIKILVNGAYGKMGKVAVGAVQNCSDFILAGQSGHQDNLAEQIQKNRADVVIDFTTPQSVFSNAQTIIAQNARPVIGTTGLTLEQIDQLKVKCQEKKLGGIIAPNFSMGAILMMRFAREAAHYLPNCEIIEMHHPLKLDAPSGTSIKTAQMIESARSATKNPAKNPTSPARGEIHHGIPIHSLRLPGFYSHQTVIFGDTGEVLTICHQGIDRQCCVPGIVLACKKVMKLDELVYGLDNILE